tara:strand:- start:1514 stop:2725 length:1212 start_codon:yes stop_codon:yes gene_type:complete
MSSKINTLHIPDQDGLFKAILSIGVDYLVDKDCFAAIDKKSFGFITRRQRRSKDNEEEALDKDKSKYLILILPEGISKLKYKDTELDVEVSRGSHPINILEHMKFKMDIKIKTTGSIEFIKEFCNTCYEEFEKRYLGKTKNTDSITHYIWDESYWDDISRRKKRKLSTISLNDTSDKILQELRDFLSSETEELYENLGVNYKKNYLFEGVPGSGKTSLIFSLASELGMDIAILHFDSKLTDVKFLQAIQRLPKNCVLVIEDVDHLFIERKKNDEYKNAITFSGILNVLDGFGSQHKLLTFITTNHECILDPAFKRPGRIDKVVHFDFATKGQIQHMYCRFLPNQVDNFDKFYKKIKHCKITTAVLQTFLFQWRTSDNIIEHTDFLIELANKNKYDTTGANMFS